jgi:hypothetical protein
MGFEGDVGGSASGAGFGDPSSGGWSGRGDVDAGPTGVNWGALADQALAAVALGLPGYAAPVGLGAQLALGKARGLSDQELENLAGYGLTNFATGGLLGATQKLGQGAQWAAKALGAQGGPQPGMGAQASSGGFGGFGPAPSAGGAPLGLAVSPAGMRTSGQRPSPRLAASLNRVLGPIPGGFMGGASPELQRRWALHAQNLATERGL